MKNKEAGIVLSFRIPREWNSGLNHLAAAEYLSKSDIVRRAIKEYLDKHQAKASPGRHVAEE